MVGIGMESQIELKFLLPNFLKLRKNKLGLLLTDLLVAALCSV